jgi:hypothetical protein
MTTTTTVAVLLCFPHLFELPHLHLLRFHLKVVVLALQFLRQSKQLRRLRHKQHLMLKPKLLLLLHPLQLVVGIMTTMKEKMEETQAVKINQRRRVVKSQKNQKSKSIMYANIYYHVFS